MFDEAKKSMLAQRTLGALRLTRSFLLLEDDDHVDWEVDLDTNGSLAQTTHPHRRTLRGPHGRSRRRGPAARRAGAMAHAPQHCISPVRHAAERRARQGATR
jgi:hypothetical protein